MSKTKKCANCSKEFHQYKSTDKYCSWECLNICKKPAIKKPYKINPASKKLNIERRIYQKKRLEFLSRPENKICEVCRVVYSELAYTIEIHHKKGRVGKLLNDENYWLAVSRKGHDWIHNNPELAYELGFLIKRITNRKI